MFQKLSRRSLLKTTATTGAMLGLGDLGFLSRLSPVSAAEAKLESERRAARAGDRAARAAARGTPRDRLLEEVADRIHKGLSYREVLAALLLAGVRNVQPRPRSASSSTPCWS